MKSRKRVVAPNRPVFKRSESSISRTPRTARIFSSISVQQNLEFFQKQISSFPRPFHNFGDADSYFKHTLRNYEHFDLDLYRPSDASKKKKSATPSRRKARSKLTTPPSAAASAPRSKFTPNKKPNKKEEPDTDIFYSPNSLASSKNSQSVLEVKPPESGLVDQGDQQQILDSEKLPKEEMAEEDIYANEFENTEDLPQEPTFVPDADEPATETEDDDEEEEEEEDEMKQVEKMIIQASVELAEVSEENQQLLQSVATEGKDEQEDDEEEEEEEHGGVSGESRIKASGDGSFFKFDPAIDAAILRELEEAEKQAKEAAKTIYELKTRVTQLLKKEKHTEAEARELEEKNKALKAQMILFEEKTKRIQFLISQTNLFDKMVPPDTPLQVSHNEDVLPKVVICGVTENNIPKLILCDEKKKKVCTTTCKRDANREINIPAVELRSAVPKFAKRLSDSYTMQEKLAAENADLEGMRYQLQSDLLNKDQTIEYLQRKLCSIQCEMRLLCRENCMLNEKMQQVCSQNQEIVKPKKVSCGKGKGPCPADIEGRLSEYSETTKLLEKQLFEMENDVKTMQSELTAVQAEREHLEQHKKVILCPPPPVCPKPCLPCAPCIVPCSDQQLRELREQYCRLQDDFKGKVVEVAGLRADNEKLKTVAKDAEDLAKHLEDKVKDLERTIKALKTEGGKFLGSKEQLIEQEQQLAVAKQRFREAQDELEELRSFIQDQQSQLDDYRNKYLEAQQEVEEQKRHIDMLEMDANRVNEQVNLEIQRVKAQFQEKLQELLPLPDLLKTTQLKLQEAQQMHLLAERNNEALNRDLQIYKDKIAEITNEMDQVRSDNEMGQDQKTTLAARIEELEVKINVLEEENFNLRQDYQNLEQTQEETERELQSKLHEIAQLSAQLETVREESARQVARNKDRCETVRRSMQNQISDLERQLAQSRAQARAAQKDRDEIRQKMQAQINNLHENFEDAQMRIRNLQGHVNFLKESYNTTLPGIADADANSDYNDPCCCGRDF